MTQGHTPMYTRPVATKVRLIEPSPKTPSAAETSALRDAMMQRSRRIKLTQALDRLLSSQPELLADAEAYVKSLDGTPPAAA